MNKSNPNTSAIIRAFDLTYSVKNNIIIDCVNFSINANDTFALLGQNGSGKSTLIDLLLDDLKPTSGEISLLYKELKDFNDVGVLYDHLPLFPMLKVNEIISYFSTIHKLKYSEVEESYFDIFEIDKIAEKYISVLSQGERKRVGLLLSIIHNPSVLILDEPFANLDPTIIPKIWKALKTPNRTIFLTTHNWVDAEKMATSIGFIYNGRLLVKPASPNDIIRDLPCNKKVIVNKDIDLPLDGLDYYLHNDELHIFFNDSSNIVYSISSKTNNFTIQETGLEDAYLFHTEKLN